MFCSCKRLDKQISLTGANRLDHVEILQFVSAEYFMTIWLIEVNLINQKVQTNHKRSERDWSCWCFQIVLVPNDGSLLMWPFLCLRARSEDILILEKWLSQSVAETLHSISLRRPFYLVFWKRICCKSNLFPSWKSNISWSGVTECQNQHSSQQSAHLGRIYRS